MRIEKWELRIDQIIFFNGLKYRWRPGFKSSIGHESYPGRTNIIEFRFYCQKLQAVSDCSFFKQAELEARSSIATVDEIDPKASNGSCNAFYHQVQPDSIKSLGAQQTYQ
jgi:hypothetical protein